MESLGNLALPYLPYHIKLCWFVLCCGETSALLIISQVFCSLSFVRIVLVSICIYEMAPQVHEGALGRTLSSGFFGARDLWGHFIYGLFYFFFHNLCSRLPCCCFFASCADNSFQPHYEHTPAVARCSFSECVTSVYASINSLSDIVYFVCDNDGALSAITLRMRKGKKRKTNGSTDK